MSIIRFGMSQSVSALHLSVIFTFSLLIILNSEAGLDISVTDLDGNPAVGVKVQVFNGDIEPSSDVEPIKPPRPRADGLVGFETNADGKVSVNVPSGGYTVVAFSSREAHKFLLMKKVTAPGQVHLSAADGAPIIVRALNAEGEPLVAANVFFRPVKRCQGLVGQIDNDGNLRVYITPGRYHVVLNSAFGLQYLVLPNQRIAGAGDEISFDIAKLPTAEVIFDLPPRAFPAIYEVLETELTYEYVEKIEEVIGYDAAYTNVYSLIGSGPVTLTAGLTYHFNISYVVPFNGAFYAYELRPRPILLSEGVHHIGNTGSENFRTEISLDKSAPLPTHEGGEKAYHPEDTVHINYRIIDTRDNQMTRYFDYSGARLIFPFVTVRNPDGVVIASNPNTFDFFHFDFKLPNSARLGEYQVEVSMNAQMYGWISDTMTFNVTARSDTSPPRISQITAPTEAEAGSEITLTADIKDDRSISGVSLNLSHDKATVQNGIISPWSQSDNRYAFRIPAEFAIPGLLRWEISATDSAGNKTTQTGEPISIKDTSPPIIEHEPIETVEIGVNLKIEATIKDNVDIADAILSYQLNGRTLKTIPITMPTMPTMPTMFTLPTIKEFGRLKYFIQASDSAGNIAYVPPRTKKEPDFIVAQIVDTIPPTIYHSPVKEAEAGVPILIEALVRDNHAVSAKSVKLNYKSTRESNFNVAPMNFSGGLYSALIPTEAATGTGIEYFIEAADEPDGRGQSRTVRAPVAGESYFITIQPSSGQILSRLEISPRGAPSAPLELEVGTIHSFRLKAYDTSGKPMPVTPIWSATGGVGLISQQGVFTATRYINGERSGTIIATVAQLDETGKPWQAIIQVRIKPAVPRRIALTPKFARLSVGEQQYFYVAVMDAYDNEIPLDANELSWNVSPHIGSIEIVGSDQPKSAWSKHQRLLFTASKMGSGVVEVELKDGRLTVVSEVRVEFGELTRIAISPTSARLVAGQRQKFTAAGFDSQGNSVPIAPLWSARDGIGTIRADGRFTAGLSGVGAVVATLGDLAAEVPVTVTEGELATITIDPFIDYLPLSTPKVKNYRQFVAFGWDIAGNPVPIGDLTWRADKAAGTIDNTGLFTATTERGTPIGNIVINGSVFANGENNLSAKSVVVIQSRPPGPPERLALFMENFGSELPKITMSVGEKREFEVTGFDANGQRMRAGGGTPKFSVLGDIGFVSPDGIFTATKGGVGEILATDSGLTARITVEVTEGTLKSIAIKPEFLTLKAGESYKFTAFGFDQFDNTVPLDDIQWSIDARGDSDVSPLASMDASGIVTAKKPGTCRLIAKVGDVEGYAQLFIQPGELNKLQLFIVERNPENRDLPLTEQSAPLQLVSGTQIQFAAKGYDIAGNELTVTPEWNVSNMLGKIAFDGNFTAIKAGEGVVTARQGFISASAKVQVSPGELHHIEVYPNPLNFATDANPTQQFRVEDYDVAGNLICQPVADLSWHVVGNLGTIDETGLFRAREGAKGSGYIVATGFGMRQPPRAGAGGAEFGSNAAVVSFRKAEKVEELIIVPNEAVLGETVTLRVGEKQKFYALGATGDSGEVFPVLAAWDVTDSVGYIDAYGVLTATEVGAGAVTAALGGISADCPITVVASETGVPLVGDNNHAKQGLSSVLTEIIAIPDTIHVKAGDSVRVSAVGKDSQGNLISINPSWQLEPSIANLGSISSNGLFIGNKSGKGEIIISAGGVSIEVPVEVVPSRPTFALIQPERVIFSAQNRNPIKFEFLTFDNRGNPTTATSAEIQWKVIGDIGAINSDGMFTPSSSDEEQHGEVIAFVPELNLLARSDVTLHGYDSFPRKIRIEPDKIDLIRGTTYRFRATVFDSMGRIVDIPTDWRVFNSNNSEIVDGVTPGGVFVVAKGNSDIGEQFRVVASAESSRGVVQGEALATMITGPLNTIEIEPQTMQLKTGETVVFSALGRDAYGNPKEIRPTWQVIGDIGAIQSHPRGSEVVTFTAVSEGTATIIATQGGIVGKAEISVTSKEPAAAELEIVVLETSLEDGDALTPGVGQNVDNPFQIQAGHSVSFIARDRITGEILSADWSIIGESSIGTISTDGQFSSKLVGIGKIRARTANPERLAEFFIRVIPGELASIQVTPAIASVLTKDTAQFSAQGYDAYGNLIIPNSIHWDVTGGIGTIDDSGIFTPTKIPLRTSIQGTVVASASDVCFPTPAMNSAIGIYGSASVTVVAELGPLSVISMTADPAIVEAGGGSVISILGADAEGNPIAAADFDAPITFTLTPNIGQIIPNSELRYRAPEKLPSESERRVVISAATTVDDKTLTAEVSLTLKPAQLAQVQLQPKSVTLKAGDTRQFHLTAADAFGNPTKVTSQWQLSKPLGTLSKRQPDAVTYTAKEAGAVELSVVATGTSDAANPTRATASIVVQPNEPTSLRIEPPSAVIVSGGKREFHVIGIDAYDNEIDELNLDWHIDGDAEVGSMQPIADNPASQIFSAAAVGDISIVAKFQSISVRADVSVIHGELSILKILLVEKLVSKEEWKDTRISEFGFRNPDFGGGIRFNDSNTSFRLISGGRYIFRAIGQDEHKNEFSPPVQWTLTGDIGKIETNADNSSLVLYQATFVGKGRLLATAGRVSAEAAIEITPLSKKIGKQGGRLDSPASASLSIPPNALTDETEISIAIIHPLITDVHDSSSDLFVDHFDFQPRGLIFKKPARLSISYKDAINKANSGRDTTMGETKLSLYFWDSFQEKWIRAGGKVDTVKKTVTASVNHLAPYTVMESKTEPSKQKKLDISDIKLTPPVFYAPETNRLTIEYDLSLRSKADASSEQAEVTVEIYDILGRLIATPLNSVTRYAGKNAEQWDGIDKDGRTVRNGRYIIAIIAKDESNTVAKKKLLVVFK